MARFWVFFCRKTTGAGSDRLRDDGWWSVRKAFYDPTVRSCRQYRKKKTDVGYGNDSDRVICPGHFLLSFLFVVIGAQITQGVMAAAILPLLASMILGLVGRKGLGHQLGRNEAWNHFGNFSTAALSGAIGYFYGIPGVFAVMLAMGFFLSFSSG